MFVLYTPVSNTQDDATMKKPTSDRNANKGASRSSKKTVHNIAPAELRETPYEMSIVNEAESDSLTSIEKLASKRAPKEQPRECVIPRESALEFSCKLLNLTLDRLQWLSSMANFSSHDAEIDRLLDSLESNSHITFGDGDALERLANLLTKLNQGEVVVRSNNPNQTETDGSLPLANAIHSAIASISSNQRLVDAIDRNTQRAIYQFAYGLTHEINNPLANIAARAQQLIPNVAAETDKRSLATIVDQTMRAHEMLAEMMRVVQPRALELRIDDVVNLIRQVVDHQMSAWTHAKLQCELRLPSKPLYSAIERASFAEAIASILQNALQVCRPIDRIEIFCEEISSGHPNFGPPPLNPSGNAPIHDAPKRIRIAVRDTGPGMNAETLDRAWDLYYSGREHGRGLGISLANVRRILDAHQGFVWIESAPNAGCTLEMRLPKLPDPAQPRRTLMV
jgi:signal transduction histidine kinase